MAFNVAKIASARSSLTISLTKSLRVAGPLHREQSHSLNMSKTYNENGVFTFPVCKSFLLLILQLFSFAQYIKTERISCDQ